MYSKNILFLFFAHGFLGSIFFNNIYEYKFSFIALGIYSVLFFLSFILNRGISLFIAWSIFGCILGIYLSQLHIFSLTQKDTIITQNLHSKIDFHFTIKDIYKKEIHSNQYIAKIESVNDKKIHDDINIMLHLPSMYVLEIGSKINTNSKIYQFKNIDNFQYQEYMKSKNIFGYTYLNSYELIEIKKMRPLHTLAQYIRSNMLAAIYKLYPQNEAIFLGGILLGARESLPSDIKEDFNNSGLTHFIAVSGFNITILVLFLGYILKYFPKTIQIIGVISLISFFVLIVGTTAPVLRAAIMGILAYIILLSGRKGQSYTLLIATASIMVAIFPSILNYDISFHLSFLAVLGIIFTQNFYKKLFLKAPEFFAIKEALVLTFAALTFTLPIMLFNFGQVSILSPIPNISVTWTIPIAMLLGFISILVYFVSPIGGEIVGYFTWILLKFDMLIVDFFGNLEFSVFKYDFGIYKDELLILYFILSVFFLLYFNVRKKEEN